MAPTTAAPSGVSGGGGFPDVGYSLGVRHIGETNANTFYLVAIFFITFDLEITGSYGGHLVFVFCRCLET